jgi:uncharacterized membrane protein YdjX (TVP38/TMEM64 family)
MIKKVILLAVIAALIASYFVFDLGQFFNFEYIKAQQADLTQLYLEHQILVIVSFFVIYVAVTALSLPGAIWMTLVGGAIFGLWQGLLIISFASTMGATLAFLSARFILRDSLQAKFEKQLEKFNQGIEKDGAFYLFTLRLVPAFPFFIINLVMGLTKMKVLTYYAVSQVGMLAGTFVFVNAGTELAKLDSVSGILSPALIGSFVLLGVFPIAAKKLIEFIKLRKVA